VTFRVEFTKSAAKALRPFQKQLRKGLTESLPEGPPDPAKTKMKGDNPFHRVRVGAYRIIYEIQNEILLILILKIGRRKEVCRRLGGALSH